MKVVLCFAVGVFLKVHALHENLLSCNAELYEKFIIIKQGVWKWWIMSQVQSWLSETAQVIP